MFRRGGRQAWEVLGLSFDGMALRAFFGALSLIARRNASMEHFGVALELELGSSPNAPGHVVST